MTDLIGLKELINAFNSKVYIVNIKQKKEEVSVERTIAEVNIETQLNNSEHFYYFPGYEDLVEGMNEFVKIKNADMITLVPHHFYLILPKDKWYHHYYFIYKIQLFLALSGTANRCCSCCFRFKLCD